MTKTVKMLTAGILLGALLLGGGYLLGKKAPDAVQSADEIEAVVLESQILDAGELVTVNYMYTELGQYENSRTFYGTKIPFTTSKFLLTYDGVLKAGIDLSEITIDADGVSGTVTVMVPKARIISHEIEEDSVRIYDEKTSIFNAFTVTDYTEFYADQKKSVESKAREKGLLTEAQNEAEIQLRKLLEPVIQGAGGGEWTLEFQLARQ